MNKTECLGGMMLEDFEYTFFDDAIAQRFCQQVDGLGYSSSIRMDESPNGDACFEVKVIGELTDEIAEQIETLYSDMLFGEQAAQIEGNEVGALADVCGVQVQLASGDYTTIVIDPVIMNKILSVLTIEELQAFLTQVAEDIETPKTGPICKRSV